jgi:hypothetical protein
MVREPAPDTDADVERCPDCRALVAPGAQWCPLCFRSLVVMDEAQVDEAPADEASEGTDAAVAPASDLDSTVVAPTADGDGATPADPAYAALLASRGDAGSVLPPLFRSSRGRAGVMAVGMLAMTFGFFAFMWLVGTLLRTG